MTGFPNDLEKVKWNSTSQCFYLLDFSLELMPQLLHGFIAGHRVAFRINEPIEHFDIGQWENEVDYM